MRNKKRVWEFRNVNGQLERRNLKTEVRAGKRDDNKTHIEGYAAVVGQTTDLGWFKEEIAPGAFTRTLQEKADVRCLFNHDPNFILGRSKSNTLSLSQDDKGLLYDCLPPDTPQANSVVTSIDRGDVDGSSFGFIVRKQEWIEEKDKSGDMITTRRILDVDLFDVSPVTFPAYEGTTADIRSLWPQGVPQEVRDRAGAKLKDALKRNMDETCSCQCASCKAGDCDECSMEGCDDEYCATQGCPMQSDRSRAKRAEIRAGKRKMRKLRGKNLTSDKFAFVADENNRSTWHLCIYDKEGVSEALATFKSSPIPDEQRDRVWNKVVSAGRKFGITITDEQNSARCIPLEPSEDRDPDQPLLDAIDNVRSDAIELIEVAGDALEEIQSADEERNMLEEFLTEARELQGLLAAAIKEVEQDLAALEPETDPAEAQRMRDLLELQKHL